MQNAAQKKSPSKQDTRDNGLKTMFWSKKLSPGKQRVNAIADNESVVQMRDEYQNGKLKANRNEKQERKKLRKLAKGPQIEGFLSQVDSQCSVIDTLTSQRDTAKQSDPMTASQVQRHQEELDEIGSIIASDDDDDAVKKDSQDDADGDKSFSPSQPILLSQKADLLQDARA